MKPFRRITGRVAVLDRTDVDTDQIIPKQFLKRIERTGYGEFLFFDWRKDAAFELNRPEYAGATILVTGRNFGCGSSREHAPWALLDYGIRAVISTEIADIFKSNSLKNGLLPIVVDAASHGWLVANPGADVLIDVATATLEFGGKRVPFPIDRFSRYCLMNGVDELGFLMERAAAITRYEQAHA